MGFARSAHIDLTPFQFEPNHLASLVHTKDFEKLKKMGGIEGLLNVIRTNAVNELSIDRRTFEPGDTTHAGSIKHREVLYGLSTLAIRKSKSLLESAVRILGGTLVPRSFVNH